MIAARCAAAVVIAALLAAIAVLVVVPRATHGAALTVLSGSMEPDLAVGSVVVVRPVDPNTLRVGDVATYRQAASMSLVTHRIVAIDRSTAPATFTFRGDANRVSDPQPVPQSAIRGKVWFDVPYLGTVRERLGRGRSWLIVGGVLCLGGFSAWQFAGAWRERSRRS